MIRYTLRCPDDHRFESWFANAGTYDELAGGGRIACPECGTTAVEKAPMAPRVASAKQPEHSLARLRRKIEAESTYVGRDFAREARAIHDGTAPERLIHGEASGREAAALLKDGVSVMPLPFAPKRRVN